MKSADAVFFKTGAVTCGCSLVVGCPVSSTTEDVLMHDPFLLVWD